MKIDIFKPETIDWEKGTKECVCGKKMIRESVGGMNFTDPPTQDYQFVCYECGRREFCGTEIIGENSDENSLKRWKEANDMVLKVRGVVYGKEIYLSKNDLDYCYFCCKYVVPKNCLWQETDDNKKLFKQMLGYIPNTTAGKIGERIICENCLGDLINLLPYE